MLRDTPLTILDHEIVEEKAAALARLGRRLERAIGALAAFDAADPDDARRLEARRALVLEAGEALWLFLVQREAIGLNDWRRILRIYQVPPEVYAAMGLRPARAPDHLPR